MAHPMGAVSESDFRVDFDPRVRLEFHGSKISSDGGLLLYRELDEALGLFDKTVRFLRDTRKGKNGVHTLLGLLRQSVFGRLAGYEAVNDAARLARDPVMRQIIGGRAVEGQAASSSQMGRFETEVLATAANRDALADMHGQWMDAVHERQGLNYITLDMDSSVSPTHGDQEGRAWNGHFRCNCYHPLFIFNQFGHLERCALRNGNVHSADDWKALLTPIIARYAKRDIMRFFRGDAAFAIPELYETLEAEGYHYAIRLKKNAVLEEKISHQLTRPVGRPSKTKIKRLYETFEYQAASWSKPRWVVVRIAWHPGELFAKTGSIVTNLPFAPKELFRFYNQRGTAEQHIITWTRLSCKRFCDNEVRLQLHALAYNLGVFLQGVDLPEEIADWSLTSIQSRLIKIGARVVRHARKITFQLAEVAISGALFGKIITAIRNIKPPPRPA